MKNTSRPDIRTASEEPDGDENKGKVHLAVTVLHFADKRAVHLLLLCIIGIIVYSNTLHAPFQWDDNLFIAGNPIIKDLGFFAHPSSARGLQYYPALVRRYIGYLSFALNYRLHGLDVTGYHIVNIAIHIFNAILVYFLAALIFRTPFMEKTRLAQHVGPLAFFSALLFVSHPMQTEAVTYIFQRLASLMTFFYLLSVVSYISSRLSDRGSRSTVLYIVSLLSAVCAMLTKESAFTLPPVLAFLEFLFFRGKVRQRIVTLLPLFLTMSYIPFAIGGIAKPVTALVNTVNPAMKSYENMLRSEYFFTQCRVVVTYLRLLLLPVNQNISHQYPLFPSFLLPPVILSFFFLAGIVASAVYLLVRSATRPDLRPIGFGILWFFITLSIESGIIPIPMVINEYRVYLPSVGLFIAFASAMFLLSDRLGEKRTRSAVVACMTVLPLLFSAAAYNRNETWRSNIALWEDTVSKSPYDPRAHFNLASFYLSEGSPEKAIAQCRIAIALYPVYPEAYLTIGRAYDMMQMTDEAIAHYQLAVGQAPGYAEAYERLAADYERRGESDKAISIYRTLKERPMDPNAR